MKKYHFFSATLFLALFLTFNPANNAFATLIATYDGNLKGNDYDLINKLINDYNSNPKVSDVPNIDESYGSSKTEIEGGDYKTYTFDNLSGVIYLLVKYGTNTDVIYVGDKQTYVWTPAEGKAAISNFTAITPEPATLILFGIGATALAGLGLRKSNKKKRSTK